MTLNRTRPALRRCTRTIVVLGLVVAAVVAAQSATVSRAAAGSVTGRAYVDGGMDGTFDTGDTGMAGVSVRAFDSTGVEVASALTDKDGKFTDKTTHAWSHAMDARRYAVIGHALEPEVSIGWI